MALCRPRRCRAGFAVLAGVLLVPGHGPRCGVGGPLGAPCWRCRTSASSSPRRSQGRLGRVVLACALVPWFWYHAWRVSVVAAVMLSGLAVMVGPYHQVPSVESE